MVRQKKVIVTTGIIMSVALLFLCNCAYRKLQALLDEPMAGLAPKLAVSITQLVIVDGRAIVDKRSIKTSKLALPGRSDSVAPTLSDSQKEMLEKELGKYASRNGNDPQTCCTLQVVEGIERYKSSWSGEEMFARSRLRVILADSLHQPFLARTVGEAEFFFTSNIANKSNFEKLYQKAMKTALFKAVESLKGAI